MSNKYKNSFRIYPAWGYLRELEDLNAESERGWQLIKGGCFGSKFVYSPDIRYRYQMDFGKVEDKARYIETFREQGWEYINTTFNNWHFFRKLYDPTLPDEEYEIFTDRDSLSEMSGRWAKVAAVIAVWVLLGCVLSAVSAIKTPSIPTVLRTAVFFIEAFVLLRGVKIMKSPEPDGRRREGRGPITAFLITVIVSCAMMIALTDMRPYVASQWSEANPSAVFGNERVLDLEVKYPDWYYLDLEAKSSAPMTVSVLSKDGKVFFTASGTDIKKENEQLRLGRGKYKIFVTFEAAYNLSLSVE